MWFLAFDTFFELIIIASLLLFIYIYIIYICVCILSNCIGYNVHLQIFSLLQKKYYNYRALWNPFYFQMHFFSIFIFLYYVLMFK